MMPTLFTTRFRWSAALASCVVAVATLTARQQPLAPQQNEVSTTITGDSANGAPRLAVPDFVALPPQGRTNTAPDAETVDAARTIGRVLWNDLDFEHEFALTPPDVAATVAAATSPATVPFDRWRELNVDGVIFGSVQKTASGIHVEVRLFNVKTRQSAFSMAYDGAVASKRLYAHRASDDIYWQQRALRGVAQTKLAFSSDRSGDRIGGSIENRSVKEIMMSDYDGENIIQVTANRSLSITPVWSPDGRSIAYTSYRRNMPNVFVSNIYEATGDLLTDIKSQNWTPAWSPDGKQIAFSSTRDGNSDIWVMNRDGSNAHQLTNNKADDITPTWSPTGSRIAFTSDRTGTEQIWEMGSDGLGQTQVTHETKADRATWSLAPFNEIAFAAQTGSGYDIKILDMTTRNVRQVTFGEGTNESPAFAPNGRHIAFTSTRAGKEQIFVIDRDGKNIRQLTKGSNNRMANWSQGPKRQ